MKHYKHVIIGGGVLGASLAQKLSSLGSVCLIEKNTIGSGTTSKSAGIIIENHKTDIGTKLAEQTLLDLKTLPIDYNRVGTNPSTGVGSGWVDPYQMVQALIQKARANSAVIKENTKVLSINKQLFGGPRGEIREECYVVNTKQPNYTSEYRRKNKIIHPKRIVADKIYNLSGVSAQTFASSTLNVCYMRSHYWEFNGLDFESSKPILLAPGFYVKYQKNKFEVGIQEKDSLVVDDPKDFCENEPIGVLIDAYPMLREYINGFDNATVVSYISGLSTYTPDGLPVIERIDPNFITVSGCNGYGITWAGGLAKAIVEGDLDTLDNNRFESGLDIKKLSQKIRHDKMK